MIFFMSLNKRKRRKKTAVMQNNANVHPFISSVKILSSSSGYIWKCSLVTLESVDKHIDLKCILAICVQHGFALLKTWGLSPAAQLMITPELILLQNMANDTCLFLNEALLHNKSSVVHRIINVR